MIEKENSSIFGAAVLKLSFVLKGITDDPGFRFVYFGTLKKLGLTDAEVSQFIDDHREELTRHIKTHTD